MENFYFLMNCFASVEVLKDFHFAVGIPCLSINALAQSLFDSIWAAIFWGPNTLMLAAFKLSAIPFANGSSGPTITNETLFSLQNLVTSCEEDIEH